MAKATKVIEVQMPIQVYGGTMHIVARKCDVPFSWAPTPGSYIFIRGMPGRLTIHWCGYEESHQMEVVTTVAGNTAADMKLDEWLEANSADGWYIPTDPTMTIRNTPVSPGGFNNPPPFFEGDDYDDDDEYDDEYGGGFSAN